MRWSELDYQLADKLNVKLGGTLDHGDHPVRPDESRTTASGITGATLRLSDRVNLRYHFEYFARFSANDGVRNLVLVDWRF